MSYATIAQLRQYLRQIPAGATEDALLQVCLDRANDLIVTEMGIKFSAYGAASDRDVRAMGGEYLQLPHYNAGTVASVEAIYGRGTSYETTDAVADWVADEAARPYRLYRDAGWTRGQWYRVEAAWGYGPAPNAAIELELKVARSLWRNRDATLGQSSIGAEGFGDIPATRAISWDERNIISALRRRYLGVLHA